MVPIFLATIEAFLAEPAEQPTAPFYIFRLMGSCGKNRRIGP